MKKKKRKKTEKKKKKKGKKKKKKNPILAVEHKWGETGGCDQNKSWYVRHKNKKE